VLQSSTATALLVSSFVRPGADYHLGGAGGDARADIGTALMVQFFALNLTWLSAVLIVAALATYLSLPHGGHGQAGKIALAWGCDLALQLIMQATAALRRGRVQVLFAQLGRRCVSRLLIAPPAAASGYSGLAGGAADRSARRLEA